MANRDQKSNREKRKPKAEKAKPAATKNSPLPAGPAMGKSGASSGKKGRSSLDRPARPRRSPQGWAAPAYAGFAALLKPAIHVAAPDLFPDQAIDRLARRR